MEIDYNHIRQVFDSLEILDLTEFEFLGRSFKIWISEYTEKEREENRPAIFYCASTVTDGWDIYLPTQLKRIFRKPVIVHESIEIILNEGFGREWVITIEEDDKNHAEAHNIAKSIDERYARDTLSEQEFSE